MEPPKGLIYTGYGDFIEHGKIHLGFLIKYAGLQPNHRVLDVGSGIGRTAVALTSYLDSNGSYEGFDAVKLGVDYCIRKITSKYPNFKFKFVDLKMICINQQGLKQQNINSIITITNLILSF